MPWGRIRSARDDRPGDALERRLGALAIGFARGREQRERRGPLDRIRNRRSNRRAVGDAGRIHQDHPTTKALDPLGGQIAEDREVPVGGDDAPIRGDTVLQSARTPWAA